MIKRLKKLNKKGFSLVELIVVIAIMAVLVGVLAPTLIGNIEKSREGRDIQTLDSIAGAIQIALADEEGNSAASDAGYVGATTLVSDLVQTGEGKNAFQELLYESLGGKNMAAGCKCSKDADLAAYVTIDNNLNVTVFFSNDEGTSAFSATKSKKTLSVTR